MGVSDPRLCSLNQCINATGMQVVAAGISEATSYGNAFAQLYHAGEFHSQWEFREMLKRVAKYPIL